MGLSWLWAAAALAMVASAERGPSLRGALEALQRRQRSQALPARDYEMYDVLPPQVYAGPDYINDADPNAPVPEYVIKILEENARPPEDYQYQVIRKKASHDNHKPRKESAFRERSHQSDNDKLKELFGEDDSHKKERILNDAEDNDEEYALLLGQLWSKYRKNKHHNNAANAPQGVVTLYKEKSVKKRYPDNWGPIAFKRKRSSGSEIDHPVPKEYEDDKKTDEFGIPLNPNYNSYDNSEDDKGDMREEYVIAFQPLDDDSVIEPNEDQYSYDSLDKSFSITKRSSGQYYPKPVKRSAKESNTKSENKKFRGNTRTDPKIIKDLSKIFGDPDDIVKTHVKRSSEDNSGKSHDTHHPPQVTAIHNNSHDASEPNKAENDHEEHGHLHHPGMAAEEENIHEKPIKIKKKAIDWSDYFGIDKRKKKSVPYAGDSTQDLLRKQYLDTFSKEVIHPSNKIKVKRNYVIPNPNSEPAVDSSDPSKTIKKRSDVENNAKLENIDRKLRNMEGAIVDEALAYSDVSDDLDSKEEQEMKEKMLSRLAAAYSLEKMRKALKEFKQSLQRPKIEAKFSPLMPTEEAKVKRVAVKKEKVEIPTVQDFKDFEDEQGAGHYLDGRIGNEFLEKYVGGSGRHKVPVFHTEGTAGSCPVLTKIVQRCGGVDMLAGDRGQLFLPLCSLHQICYLCGEAPPTTCDLVFLSEADTACEGDMSCQRAARSALMTLRELHDHLADELDGECEASPCLPATLRLNDNWQRALQR